MNYLRMVKYLISLTSLCLFLSTSHAQDFNLTALNGTVVGQQEFGSQVHVYADLSPGTVTFSGWTGPDANKLTHPSEWHTTFLANSSDGSTFEIQAQFDTVVGVNFEERTFPAYQESSTSGIEVLNKRVFASVPAPEDIKAFVFAFHGTNGSGLDWKDRYEQRIIMRDLAYNGYAVFAIDANEYVAGDQNGDNAERWIVDAQRSDTSSNIDLKNLVALRRYATRLYGDKPVFSYGGSNGANFADFSAAMLDYTGVCHMFANGNSWLYSQQRVEPKPAIWIQSRNDQNQSSDSLQAKANFQALTDRGIQTEWFWLDKAPAYPTRFQRSLERISPALSSQLYASLKSEGYLNERDYVTITRIKTDFDSNNFFSNFNLSEKQENEVMNQLEILNAEHAPHSEYSNQVIRFFDGLLAEVTSSKEIQDLKATIAPNPAHTEISINLENESNYAFQLMNSVGKVEMTDQFHGAKHRINISYLSKGLHILLIRDLSTQERVLLPVIKR